MASVGTEPLCFAFVLPCRPSVNWANQGFGAAVHPSCSGSSAAGWESWSGDLTGDKWCQLLRAGAMKEEYSTRYREKRELRGKASSFILGWAYLTWWNRAETWLPVTFSPGRRQIPMAYLTAVRAEVWVVCAGQDKTPGEIWAGAHGTAGLSWDTDQEGSMTPVSEEETIRERFKDS